MSREDLEKHGILLPRKTWGRMDLSTSGHRLSLGVVFLLGISACVLMAAGAGGSLTWLGALLFVLFLFVFAFVSNNGIERRNRECEQILRGRRERGEQTRVN